ncbi:hypothetical protein CTAYLR_008591 [Chrysophaeum taylorii]|uniref:Uncharacterized protein n=1 Tax=Chrysophaeum taylorii TaxID=2483200 RepID=A0AAD7UN58_9STRA|nr:hypothetical protein CTAYLR_008591 [Chrysophaeum taylorii]
MILRHYGALAESNPYSVAFATCAAKGVVADAASQVLIEHKKIDWKRNFVFSFYGGFYCGWAQHFIYNVLYTKLFGPETTVVNAARKVVFDSLVHVPFVVFPVYYAYKGLVYDGVGIRGGLNRCREDIVDMCRRYYTVWIPANIAVFTFVPERFRIAFVATTSLGWLTLASFFTHGPS